jgi:aminoglycoside phosphotransferase (APT) family kinase protein
MRRRDAIPSLTVALSPRTEAGRQGRFRWRPTGIANPASASDVAHTLLEYFQTRLHQSSLAFAAEPVAFADGWEADNYGLQLKGPDLPSVFAQPLLVRIYCGLAGLGRARREILVQRHLRRMHYPVPEPLLLEESCAYFGGPFLVRTQVRGPTLLRTVLHRPWRLYHASVQMAEAQVRLHRLPTCDFPTLPGCFLFRRLDEMSSAIREYGLRGLRSGIDWLTTHRPDPPKDRRILHLDFHPLNLIEDANRSLVVLDWNEADLGDPHADVGTTVMLMDCLPTVRVTRLERLAILAGRFFFQRWYLRAYRRHLPLDENKLSYYRAFAAFCRLCNYGRWLQDGPQINGHKPALLDIITDNHRQTLEHYFRKWTGAGVRL